MKLITLLIVLIATNATNAFAGGSVQKICKIEKGKEVCKNIKVHKKVEGNKVPNKK